MGPHYDTLTKAKVQGAYEFLRKKGLSCDSCEIFDTFGVARRAGYDIIKPEASSRRRAHQNLIETRGRKPKMTAEQVREADHLLQDDDLYMEAKGAV